MDRVYFKIILVITLFYNFIFVYDNDILFPVENNVITGGFGEFRWNHLHTGIDISTEGIEGKKIFAPTDCWVSYIKRDFYGYGNTLFLEDENFIYVLAHLKSFVLSIDTILSKEKFRQILYPEYKKITFRKGDLVGYTGSSGNVVPHLHFEVRSKNNKIINPLFLYNIYDTIKPVIGGILFEPADDSSLIEGEHDNFYYKLRNGSEKEIRVRIKGKFFISLKAIDRINSYWSKIFVYEIDIKSGSNLISTFKMDSFSFKYNTYSPIHFRTGLNISNSNYLLKFYDTNNSTFFKTERETLYSYIDTTLTIIVKDFYGNKKELKIKILDEIVQKSYPSSLFKLKRVNDKIVFIITGKKTDFCISKEYKNMFDSFEVSKNYKYYILNYPGFIKKGFFVNNHIISKNVVYLDSSKQFNFNDSIAIKSFEKLYFIYDTKKYTHRELKLFSNLYSFDLKREFHKKNIKISLKGYGGKSFYNVKNNNLYFVKKLNDEDSILTYNLNDFIIGNDFVKPKHFLINKKIMKDKNIYTYRVVDFGSGIDWFYIADSNSFYVEPIPGKSKIKIVLYKNTKNEKIFIKDKDGNKDTIFLY